MDALLNVYVKCNLFLKPKLLLKLNKFKRVNEQMKCK